MYALCKRPVSVPSTIILYCPRGLTSSQRVKMAFKWGCSCLVSHSLKALCALVFADLTDRICVVEATIKDQAFNFSGVYAPNECREGSGFPRRIDPFLTTSRRVF